MNKMYTYSMLCTRLSIELVKQPGLKLTNGKIIVKFKNISSNKTC